MKTNELVGRIFHNDFFTVNIAVICFINEILRKKLYNCCEVLNMHRPRLIEPLLKKVCMIFSPGHLNARK